MNSQVELMDFVGIIFRMAVHNRVSSSADTHALARCAVRSGDAKAAALAFYEKYEFLELRKIGRSTKGKRDGARTSNSIRSDRGASLPESSFS